MKRNLARHKNDEYVAKANSCEEVRDIFLKKAVIEKHGYTLDGDAKFYINTVIKKDFAFTIYASKFVIDFIKEKIEPHERKYLMDGTFDCMPKYFYQLLIISVEYQHEVSENL